MLIHDLDYSEKIYSESRVFGGKTVISYSKKIKECKATSNGKGVVCKTISTECKSGDVKAVNPDSIHKYIEQVAKSVQTGSLASLWLNF